MYFTFQGGLYLNQNGIDKELFICEQPNVGEDVYLDDGDQSKKNISKDLSLLDSLSLQIDQVVSLKQLPDDLLFSQQQSAYITSDVPDAVQNCITFERLPDDLTRCHQKVANVTTSLDRLLPEEENIFYQKRDIISGQGESENNSWSDGCTDDDDLLDFCENKPDGNPLISICDNELHNSCNNKSSDNELHNLLFVKSELGSFDNFDNNFQLNGNFQIIYDNQQAGILNFNKLWVVFQIILLL